MEEEWRKRGRKRRVAGGERGRGEVGGWGGGGAREERERSERERERDHCGLHDRTIGLSGSEFSASGVLFGFTSLSVRYLCFVSGVHQPPCQFSHCRCPACSNWSTLTTLTINLGNGETDQPPTCSGNERESDHAGGKDRLSDTK